MIRAARLTLRPPRLDDFEALHAIVTDPETMRYWTGPAHTTASQTQELLGLFMSKRPETYEYMVDLNGQMIGRVAIWRPWELGFLFSRDHWGKGYASEACAALLGKVFSDNPKLTRITAEIDPRNRGSAAVLRKLGFTQTDYQEKNFLYGGFEWTDTAYYALTKKPAAL